MIDELSFAGRTALLARYRAAYEAANGRKAVVLYWRHRYQVQDGRSVCRMRRRAFIEALLELERRAGFVEEIEHETLDA